MKNELSQIRTRILGSGLKSTPQRIAVYNLLVGRSDHPTAEAVYQELLPGFPGLSLATVYNVLDSLCEKKLIRRVKTERGTMRYDAIEEAHHHLYCESSDRMEDYADPDLDQLLSAYFMKKEITGFRITDIKLQLTGIFQDNV